MTRIIAHIVYAVISFFDALLLIEFVNYSCKLWDEQLTGITNVGSLSLCARKLLHKRSW